MKNYVKIKNQSTQKPLIDPKKRIVITKKVKGIWKERKPEPIKELNRIRKEWNQ